MSEPAPSQQHRVFAPTKATKGPLGWLVGIPCALIVMLLIPISQYLASDRPETMELESMDIAMPPPPPPIEREPPPPEPEEKQEPPELDVPPPQLSLDQLDLALNPGTGGNLAGDFGLGGFAVNQDTLGGIDVFDVEDLDTKPQLRSQKAPRFSRGFLRTNKNRKLIARISFILNEQGRVEKPEIIAMNVKGAEEDILDAIKKWRYDPPMREGKPVKAKYIQPLILQIQ